MNWFRERSRPLVIAHQGGQGLRPTNTLMAYQEAVRLGSDVLDTDVHLTRDGVLVAIHDDTVDRTTEGQGRVRDFTLDELQQLDAGYRFTEDGRSFPYRGEGVRIPTLEELLAAFPDHPWIIELKPRSREAAQELGRLLHGQEGRAVVGSFDHLATRDVRRYAAGLPTCASQAEVALFYLLSVLGLARFYRPRFHLLAVPLTWNRLPVVTARFAKAARSRGLALAPWTVNEPQEMRRLLPWVDGINTDRPDVLLQVLDEHPPNCV